MYSYLDKFFLHMFEPTGVKNSFSLWKDIAGVLQGQYLVHFFLTYILTTYFFSLYFWAIMLTILSFTQYKVILKSNKAILSYNFRSLQNWIYESYTVVNPGNVSVCVSAQKKILLLKITPRYNNHYSITFWE